ncbi:MAG TPA: hypothetical protein VEG35_05885, partial [Burkholderiales bacterium]|nr:hypothetical protein [Burkholderiales bacterium]
MGPRVRRVAGRIVALSLVLAGLGLIASAEEFTLDNGRLRAEFNERGQVMLGDIRTGRRIAFSSDPTFVTIDETKTSVGELGPAEVETKPAKLTFRYVRDPYTFDVSYELRPGWAFLSKQVVVASAGRSSFRLKEVALLDAKLDQPVLDELKLADGRWGSFCRFGASGAAAGAPAWGLFFAVQNPYL